MGATDLLHTGVVRSGNPIRQARMNDIGKRIDALQGRIAGLQSRLETVQRELNEVKLEYVRNDEIQRRETAQANADDLVVDAVGEVPPVDMPAVVPKRGAWGEAGVHCCIDRECGMVPSMDDTRHCNCVSKNAPPSNKLVFYACDKDTAEKNNPQRMRAVPAWRRKVDEAERDLDFVDDQSPLSVVLYHLYRLASPHNTVEPSWCLAKIVAICERTSGEAADPVESNWGADIDPNTVEWLLDSLTRFYSPANWKQTANRAASWLRDILNKEQT